MHPTSSRCAASSPAWCAGSWRRKSPRPAGDGPGGFRWCPATGCRVTALVSRLRGFPCHSPPPPEGGGVAVPGCATACARLFVYRARGLSRAGTTDRPSTPFPAAPRDPQDAWRRCAKAQYPRPGPYGLLGVGGKHAGSQQRTQHQQGAVDEPTMMARIHDAFSAWVPCRMSNPRAMCDKARRGAV